MKHALSLLHLVWLVLLLGPGYEALAGPPVIFHASLAAQPGEAISLQGEFSAAATVWLRVGAASEAWSVPVPTQRAGHCIAQLPAALAYGLYQVWVNDGGVSSPVVYVNRAWGQHFDSPETAAGHPFRLFGRNLRLGGGTPQVRLVNRSTGASSPATVDAARSDAYVLHLTAPADVRAGATYDVFVSNGLAGPDGETPVDKPLLGIAAGPDYFRLGVAWAGKLDFYQNLYNVRTDARLPLKAVGDGNANDQPALQAAIDQASADGGGIVYLPAGTYKLDGQGVNLSLKSRVVVQGAGLTQTTLRYGYGAPGNGKWGLFWSATRQAGLADLTVVNVDATGKWINNMTNGGTATAELFIQRCRFDLAQGDWLWLAGTNKLVVTNSEFTQGISAQAGYHGPVQFNQVRHFLVAHNTFRYAVDGLSLNEAQEGVFEHNQVFRDGSARYPSEVTNHVLILNFAENIAVANNLFRVVNGPAQDKNDGETIIAEGGAGDRIDEDAGTVSAATATTLRDNSKSWNGFRQQPVVAIVNGPGMGQWRTISRRSGNTLTVDRAWDVLPTAASRYSTFNWGSHNWLIRDNALEGNRRGITLYFNATNQVAIVGNRLTNSGSIDLTPLQQANNQGVPQEFVPMYDNQIVGNTVEDLNGSNGVFIGVHTVQFVQEKTFGTSVIGLEVRGNTLTAHVPNVPAEVDATFPEGYLNYLQYQSGGLNYADEQIPAVLGTIFQNNTAINTNSALYLNTGSYNTFVCNTTLNNAPNLIDDHRFDGNSHAAVGTAYCPPSSPAASLRAPDNPAGAVAGLDYQYYEGSWNQLPDFNPLTPTKTGTTPGFDLTPRGRNDQFGFRFAGYVNVSQDGQYTFYTTSDDGSRLYIGNQLVVDNDGQHPAQERSGQIGLRAGRHALVVAFFEQGGQENLAVSYAGPELTKTAVPITALFRVPAGSAALSGYYTLVAKHSGKALDGWGGALGNGAELRQHGLHGGGNQQFLFEDAGDGYYQITVRHSGKALAILNAASDNGGRLVQHDYLGQPHQQFRVEPLPGGYYRLTVRSSGRVLDVAGGSTDDGGVVHQWDWLNQDNQQWRLAAVGSPASRAASDQATRDARLSAYPNPNHGAVTLTLTAQRAQTVQGQVFDQWGRLVGRFGVRLKPGHNQHRLPVALSAGTYYLHATIDGQARTFTLRVE